MFNSNKYILKFKVLYDSMVSTNEAYFHMPKKSKKSNRMTTYTVKTDKLKNQQSFFNDKLHELIQDDYGKIISDLIDTKFYGLKIVTVYSMPFNNYRDSDVTNYIKNYEDCIASRLRQYNKNLDDRNNIEYRAIKRFRNSDSDLWEISTLIYPIERDIQYRMNVLKLHCPLCNDLNHADCDSGIIECRKCGTSIGLEINHFKKIYGITRTFNENQCSVCGSLIGEDSICTYCGIDKNQYSELINKFNEEECFDYEE